MLPSGISKTRTMSAITPVVYKSSKTGSSVSISFWQTTPIKLFLCTASLIRRIDLGRPIITGKATPGKSTIFLNGRMGIVSPTFSIPSVKSSSTSHSVRIGITIPILSSKSSNEFWQNTLVFSFIYTFILYMLIQ